MSRKSYYAARSFGQETVDTIAASRTTLKCIEEAQFALSRESVIASQDLMVITSLPQLIILRSLMGRTTRLVTFLSPLLHIILHENRRSYLNIIPCQRSIRASLTSHTCALSIVCRGTSAYIRSSKSSKSRNLPQQMSAIIGS